MILSDIAVPEGLWDTSKTPEGIVANWFYRDGSTVEAGAKVAELMMEDHEGNLWCLYRDRWARTSCAMSASALWARGRAFPPMQRLPWHRRQDGHALGGNQRKRAECDAPRKQGNPENLP